MKHEFKIGRDSSNHIIIDDASISRNHALLSVIDEKFKIRDLDSLNGTFINGVRINGEAKLETEDILKLGSQLIPWMSYVESADSQGPAGASGGKPEAPEIEQTVSSEEYEIEKNAVSAEQLNENSSFDWYLKCLKQFADFKGRARRKEYWMFTLFNFIFTIITMIIDNVIGIANPETGYGLFYIIYAILMFIPGLAVAVRRLHDVGKSGIMLFISLIPLVGAIWLLVLACTDSQNESNKWGSNPKGIKV